MIDMRRFPRPSVVVSACPESDSVGYDGKVFPCPLMNELDPFVDFIKVCPEYEIGLDLPPDPLRIVNVEGRDRLIQPRTGRDVTDLMDAFTDRFLASLPPVDGFLFKTRSPTIGFYDIKVYDHPVGPGVARKTSGLFARKILRHYAGYPMEDDMRMRNYRIRDDFLTRLFTFAGFREAAATGDPGALRDFHERNRCLFTCYAPDAEKRLAGQLARGNADGYFEAMKDLLSNPSKAAEYVDVATHIFDGYRDRLSSGERNWFSRLVERYRKNKAGRESLLEALELFAIRMSDGKTAEQTLFAPYPGALVQDADQERDRDYRKLASLL